MRTAAPDAAWNDATIARLRSLWSEGLSTNEIGLRLGVSKNAVVGKAHRLRLPGRPSPIRRDGAPRPKRPPRVTGPTLPALRCLERKPSEPPARPYPPARVGAEPPPPRMPAPPVPAPQLGRSTCCWPIGEPGTAPFRFCDAPNLQGWPYCPDHHALAYVPEKRRPDQEATDTAAEGAS